MKMHLARNKDGHLFLYLNKVKKGRTMWGIESNQRLLLSTDDYPEVKWEDEEPTEVELIIKENNGRKITAGQKEFEAL